jgi:hypothetical protein
MESSTFEMVRAGDQLSLRMSRHITPWLFMLQWYMRVRKVTCGKKKKQSASTKVIKLTCYFWGFEGVVGAEVDVQEENTSLVDGAGRAENGRHPFV